MMDDPVAHIVMSRSIKNAIEKYKNHNEWREAALKFESGQSTNLTQQIKSVNQADIYL